MLFIVLDLKTDTKPGSKYNSLGLYFNTNKVFGQTIIKKGAKWREKECIDAKQKSFLILFHFWSHTFWKYTSI